MILRLVVDKPCLLPHPIRRSCVSPPQDPEYCEQISEEGFESTVHMLLSMLEQCQGKDPAKHFSARPYARGLLLLLSGYGKDIHKVIYAAQRLRQSICSSFDAVFCSG